MIGRVQVLSEEVANRIAAGEVVERPASVVKELLENSIDAQARSIGIELRGSGRQSIRVEDDGIGMGRDDAILAFERHATSKIGSLQDLKRIRTLGFRGEALPSIAAISHFCLTTSPRGEIKESPGTRIELEGGIIRRVEDAARAAGTLVEVRRLFYNTPVRLKFLKSSATELHHICQVVTQQALAQPSIRFKLSHEDRPLVSAPPAKDLAARLASLFGAEFSQGLLPLELRDPYLRGTGFVSKPSFHRSQPGYYYAFVNGRHVRGRMIHQAIAEAYRAFLPKDRHPVAFLFLQIDPEEVDVNVHPTKAEIRFARERQAAVLLQEAIQAVLSNHQRTTFSLSAPETALPWGGEAELAPGKEAPAEPFAQGDRPGWRTEASLLDGQGVPPAGHDSRDPRSTGELSRAALSGASGMPGESVDLAGSGRSVAPPVEGIPLSAALSLFRRESGRPRWAPIGQIQNSFILLETPEALLVLDQHAAHERVLYEEIKERLRGQAIPQQSLLGNASFNLPRGEALLLQRHLDHFERLGFTLEPFGGETFIIRAVPALLVDQDYPRIIQNLLDALAGPGSSPGLEEVAEEMIRVIACHGAIKANQPLQVKQMQGLVERLQEIGPPYTCPHGRPILQSFGLEMIRKGFLRS